MRYRLRTLLILLALGPVVLAGQWFAGDWALDKYRTSQQIEKPLKEQRLRRIMDEMDELVRQAEKTGHPFPEEPVIVFRPQPVDDKSMTKH